MKYAPWIPILFAACSTPIVVSRTGQDAETSPTTPPEPPTMATIHLPPECDRYILDVQPDHPDRWNPSTVYPGSVVIACLSENGGSTHRQNFPLSPEMEAGIIISHSPSVASSTASSTPLVSHP